MNIFDNNQVSKDFFLNPEITSNQKDVEKVDSLEPLNVKVKQEEDSFSKPGGIFLNGSDSQLINDHLQKYIHSPSLRLEIQIERLTESKNNNQKKLNSLNLLNDSSYKDFQEIALIQKQEQINKQLNAFKEEYCGLSKLHTLALWLKDFNLATGAFQSSVKKVIYKDKIEYINELQSAKKSIELLIENLSNQDTISSNDKELNFGAVIKEYEKINFEINQFQQKYFDKQTDKVFSYIKKLFQKIYYGIELKDHRN